MAKEKLLLVNLNEEKTKKISEIISSDTSRKILDYLADKDDTEKNISDKLEIPISTVHYHLQKLMEAQLVVVEEFHYSKKGREVNHYKLANKYIIIAPKKISGIKRALKNILPVGLITLGIGAVIKFVNLFVGRVGTFASMEKAGSLTEQVAVESMPLAKEAMVEAGREATMDAAPQAVEVLNRTAPPVVEAVVESVPVISQGADIALWFLIGGFTVIFIYLLVALVKEWWKK